jgi:hypothetical protein
MFYRVDVFKQGSVIKTLQVVASNAKEAIAVVEKQLQIKPIALPMADGGRVVNVAWSGFEFQARRVLMDRAVH